MEETSTSRLRLKELMSHYGLNQTQMAKRIGVNVGNLSKILSGKRPIGDAIANKIILSFDNVDKDWLLYGIEKVSEDSAKYETAPPMSAEEEEKTPDKTIPLLPVSVAAGALSGYSPTVMPHECSTITSPFPDAEVAIPVNGHSMEPDYPHGAIIHLRRVNDALFIEWGRTYVLDTENGPVLKQLVPADTPDAVRCLSINPAPQYAPFDVPRAAIYAIYRVVGLVVRK